MDFDDQGIITSEDARSKDTAHALMAGDKGSSAMEKIKETYHESNTSVSPTIRTDL